MRNRKILPFVFLGLGSLLIVASIYLYLALRDQATPATLSAVPAKVKFPAPELTLTDTQGVSHSLADYRGQVVLVNLWATWCPPCKQEMPALQAFYDKYNERGFAIVAINDGDPKADVLQFVQDYRLTFPVWLDPTYLATDQVFRVASLPTSYVIDRNGTVQLTWTGGIDYATLEKYVAPMILQR